MYWTGRASVIESTSERHVHSLSYIGGIFILCLVIVGCGGGGNSDKEPPLAPSGLTGTSGNATIELDWKDVESGDLDGYRVYRSTSSIDDVSGRSPVNSSLRSSSSFTDTSDKLENGTTFHYVVTAVDNAGNESPPSGEVAKTPFPTPDRPR